MTSQGGGGGSSYPDVAGDGQTPGGLTIAGGLTAGGHDDGTTPSFIAFRGTVGMVDTAANAVDSDDVLFVAQTQPGTMHSARAVASFARGGTVGASDYLQPAVHIDDSSDSAQPLLRATKAGVAQFQVDVDGIQVHGKFKSGSSVTHTLGAYSGKSVPIYDESGTLLGYMPLYA